MSGLCSLDSVKTLLGISSSDTSKDAKLQLFIDQVSAQMIQYVGYQMHYTTYTDERHAINNSQLMYLNGAPLQTVTSVTCNGVSVLPGTDDNNYQFDDTDKKAGRIYLGTGWIGNYFTRNMTYDPVAGQRSFLISYSAGWYFPGDTNYSSDNAGSFNVTTSLPYAISAACQKEVITNYRKNVARAEGLTSYSEGGISWGWGANSISAQGNIASLCGLSQDCAAVLNQYKRWGFA